MKHIVWFVLIIFMKIYRSDGKNDLSTVINLTFVFQMRLENYY